MRVTLRLGLAIACLTLLPVFAVATRAATITIGSATVSRPHQEEARLCVGLDVRAGELIAGTENEIVWDGECATIIEESCAANPAHRKNLSGALQRQRDFIYKALVLAFTDTNPIPAGDLYCCNFLVHARPGDCCRVRIASPGASDPHGNPMPVNAGPPGELCVAPDGSSGGSGRGGGRGTGGGGSGGLVPPVDDGGGLAVGAPPAGGAIAPPGAVVLPGGGGFDFPSEPDLPVPGPVGEEDSRQQAAEAAPVGGAADEPQAGAVAERLAAGMGDPQPPKSSDAESAKIAPEPGNATAEKKPEATDPAAAAAVVAGEGQDSKGDPDAGADAAADSEAAAAADSEAAAAAPATGEAAKPSPRDVRREQQAAGGARSRRFPLDDDGCQIRVGGGGALQLLAAPLLLWLLRSRRRNI